MFILKPHDLIRLLEKNVLVLDGAMGTMIQRYKFTENDFRGVRFVSHDVKLSGCNDLLCLVCPDRIKEIHNAYLNAGADIISTNSFNANGISMEDYGLQKYPGLIKEINRAAAAIAKECANNAPLRRWGGPALVAGSIGPTNRTASMSPEVGDPAYRNVTYDMLFEAYSEQIAGLIEGGIDILLFETVFDTLNLKAGLDAANYVMREKGEELPIMISATISDKSGRTLSGQTLAAFVTSIEEYDNVVSLGLNCSFGPSDIIPYVKELGNLTRHFISCHPNAGLPNAMGEYDETPELFSSHVETMLRDGFLNIVGGCCGTTPEHIAAVVSKLPDAKIHVRPEIPRALRVSGLERVEVLPENNFVNVGERCNVAGSRKFLRLIKEKKYEEAMMIALHQVEDGAMMIDVNMDDAMLDAKEEMVHFLRYIASDPDISKVPVMVDSSDWTVVEAALKNLQGKSIVNSISLKEGEESFLKKAKRIRQLGAAVIVMAFDEKGQADTYQRKIDICRRAYDLLVSKCGFPSDDIIFDVNIMAVATGIEEHNRYGIDYIEAVRWIKNNLPGARTSGGVSNLSFAFRGKNALREAMHAVFLYHAIDAGLDMGIVNPATSVTYEDIEPKLRTLIEDVILARRAEAPEELADYAANDTQQSVVASKSLQTRDLSIPVSERLENAIIKGNPEFLNEDLDEAIGEYESAVKIIEGPLMDGMNRVGELFGAGKMFLPQVVKTARTMKLAVDHLRPLMEAASNNNAGFKAGKVIFATVKGDVHDIGKNIVSIVLACNNYEVIDLGVMVPAETIVETAIKEKPDFVCLSGLITPSLSEMVNVAKAMEQACLHIPLLVGGATTSRIHTALKIAPVYHAPVVHMTDAAQNPIVASKLLNPDTREDFVDNLDKEYSELRDSYNQRSVEMVTLSEARKRRLKLDWLVYDAPMPNIPMRSPMVIDVDLAEVGKFINWKMFFHAWRLTGGFLDKFPYDGCPACVSSWKNGICPQDRDKAEEAWKLYSDAQALLSELISGKRFDGKAAIAFYESNSEGDDIIIGGIRLPLLRQQRKDSEFLSLADFIAPIGIAEDIVGAFVVTAGLYLSSESERLKEAGDSYGSLLRQSLADRIAEATSEWLHAKVRKEYWGYSPQEKEDVSAILKGGYRGIRPAMGYPMLPDQLLNKTLAKLLPMSDIGVSLTENGAMMPTATVSGLYVSHPESRYFMIGVIGEDQLKDYAMRREEGLERIKDILRM